MNKEHVKTKIAKFKIKEKNHTKKVLTNKVATNQQVKRIIGLKFNFTYHPWSLSNNKVLVLIRHFFRETHLTVLNN